MNKDISCVEEILEQYGKTIPVPIELLINPKYNKNGDKDRLKHNSAILYGALLLLKKNKDEDGKYYIDITGNEIATLVGTTTSSVPTRMIKELERFDLIERGEFKRGEPYKIYIKDIKR